MAKKFDTDIQRKGGGPSIEALTLAMAQASDSRKTGRSMTSAPPPGSLVLNDGAYIYSNKFQLTTTSLEAINDITPNDWRNIGMVLAGIESSIAWWIGDWANLGHGYITQLDIDAPNLDTPNGRYLAIAMVTGYKYQTLRSYASTCASVEPHIRRPELSFAHHRYVASLDEDEQIEWLDNAVKYGWSVRELRERLAVKDDVPSGDVSFKKQANMVVKTINKKIQDIEGLRQIARSREEVKTFNELVLSLIEQLNDVIIS